MVQKTRVQVRIDWEQQIAYVSRGCVEKYARRLLQEKLKAETPFKGGWECWLTNKDHARWLARDKWTAFIPFRHYDHPEGYTRPWNEDDDNFYIYELHNQFAKMAGYL